MYAGDEGRRITGYGRRFLRYPEYQPASIHLLFAIFNRMGRPRSWQLEGLDELENLDPGDKAILRRLAADVLAEMEPRDKYFFIWEPFPTLSAETLSTLDLTDEKIIEERHWAWTMPAAFVERIAKLLE